MNKANLSKLIAKSVIDEMRVIKESMPDEPEDDEDDDHFLNDDTILDDDNGMLLESEDDDLDDFAMPAQPVKAPTPSAPMPTPSSKPPSSLKIVDADDDDNEEDHMQTIAVVPKLPVVSFTVPPADDLLLRGFTAILHQDKGTPRSVLVIVFKEVLYWANSDVYVTSSSWSHVLDRSRTFYTRLTRCRGRCWHSETLIVSWWV